MSRQTKVGIALVVAAVPLGVLGDALFQSQPLGLNVPLWTVSFVVALALLLRVARAPLHQGRRFMVAPLLVFSALFVWHDSPLLVAANLLALGGGVSVGALRGSRPRLRAATLTDYGTGFLHAARSALAGALLMSDVRWEELAGRARSEKATAVARGLALGVPLLCLFGALFVTADAVFKHLLSAAVPTIDVTAAEPPLVVAVWASPA